MKQKATKKSKPRESGKPRPLSRMERAKLRPRFGETQWFNARRLARPAPKRFKPAGGVIVPKNLLKGASELVHAAMVPPEAELLPVPRFTGPPPQRRLKRFSGKRVIPVNQTYLDDNDDERNIYSDSSFPWCSIGRIQTPGGSWGTGTLAGKNFIVTASHVVAGLWTPNQPITQNITFVPASFDGQSILGPNWIAAVIGIAAWEEISKVVGYDMAICQLDQPMGDWLGYFGSRGYDDDWEDNAWWEHAGYPFDLSPAGSEPSYEFNITIDDDDGDDYDTVELETDADIASGQSGGPLWAIFDDGGHQIIGVLSGHQGGFWETTNIFAGGSGLNGLVKWGRDNW